MSEELPAFLARRVEHMEMVQEFHKAHDGGQPDYMLARRLIHEEMEELEAELMTHDEIRNPYTKGLTATITQVNRANVIKEMADVMYVLYGFADRFNIDLDEAFSRVHESNMSKVALDGKIYFRKDGKVMKPDHYKAPELGDL